MKQSGFDVGRSKYNNFNSSADIDLPIISKAKLLLEYVHLRGNIITGKCLQKFESRFDFFTFLDPTEKDS